MTTFPPFLLYFLAAAALPLLPRGTSRSAVSLLAPLAALALTAALPYGTHTTATLFGQTLILLRLDPLAWVFSLIFSIAAILGTLFAWRVRDLAQQIAALVYMGAALGALHAGDLLTLFCLWEATAFASVFLIWARRAPGAYATGMRYLLIQVLSGLLLLAGALLHIQAGGDAAFTAFPEMTTAAWLILIAFGIKCAFPLLGDWLQDAYPAATPTGAVILSAFTTKLAVYALIRGFPGFEPLIYIGAAMALYPVFYAIVENDLRRVLAFSLNNQLGFIVVGIGIGTPLALNGAIAHAVCHILYKGLLFMAMGAVIVRAGSAKVTDLRGTALYRSMPWTLLFCLVGAASISAFPLFSGFVSKSLLLAAVDKEGYAAVWLILLFASAGVFLTDGIKIPYRAFFSPAAHDDDASFGTPLQEAETQNGDAPFGTSLREAAAKKGGWAGKFMGGVGGFAPHMQEQANRIGGMRGEAPPNMLLAMGLAAILCIGIGVAPATLFALLPYDAVYNPYTAAHILFQLQLLAFAALTFMLLLRYNRIRPESPTLHLRFDALYRRLLPALLTRLEATSSSLTTRLTDQARHHATTILRAAGVWSSHDRSSGIMLAWVGLLLAAILSLAYLPL